MEISPAEEAARLQGLFAQAPLTAAVPAVQVNEVDLVLAAGIAVAHTLDEGRDAAIWLQHDSAYLYRCAMEYRDRGTGAYDWLAAQVQVNAAHSAFIARMRMGIEAGSAS